MTKEKKQFTKDSGLGFMRFFVFITVLSIIFESVLTIFVRGSSVDLLHFSTVNAAVSIGVRAASVWLVIRRKEVARKAVPVLLAIDYLNGIIMGLIDPDVYGIATFISYAIVYILLGVYFLTSRRAKAVLVNPIADETLAQIQAGKNRNMWDLKSKDFWLRLILYFFIFSILGHWMEMGVQVLVIAGIMPGTVASADSLTWRDSLNPFFIYGIAVVICGLLLYPIFVKLREKLPKKWQGFVASFLINTAFCAIAEIVLGILFNQDHHAWNYSNQFLNWEGQICLLYTVLFGLLSSVITWGVYPLLERQFSRVSRDVFRIVFVVAVALYILIYFTFNVDLGTLMPGSHMDLDVSNY